MSRNLVELVRRHHEQGAPTALEVLKEAMGRNGEISDEEVAVEEPLEIRVDGAAMTLAGFARGARVNVYTRGDRVRAVTAAA